MVDRTGLENRRAARSRGFESLSLRQVVIAEPNRADVVDEVAAVLL